MAPKPRSVLVSLIGIAGVAGLLWVSFRTDPVPVDLATVIMAPLQVTDDAEQGFGE